MPPLLGRDPLIERIDHQLVPEARVVLVGPGGIGKTSIAHALLDRRPGVFVDLTAASEAAHVWQALSDALGAAVPGDEPSAVLARRVATTDRVVVIDNAEQVLAAVEAFLCALVEVEGAPPVVVTSRVQPSVRGVHVVRVPALAGSDGRALFLDHAHPEVVDPVRDGDDIDALVDRLGGNPLAVRIAAGRTALQGVPDLLRSLAVAPHRAADLTGELPARHASIQRVIADSWDLLAERERGTLSRLAIAASPLTLDDLTAWGLSAPSLLALTRASVIHRHVAPDGGVALSLPVEIRSWILHDHPPPFAARVEHARWLAARAGPLARRYHGYHPQEARAQLVQLMPELRSALEHAADLPPDLAGALAEAYLMHLAHVDLRATSELATAWAPWIERLPWPARAGVVFRVSGGLRRYRGVDEALTFLEPHLQAALAEDSDAALDLKVSKANHVIYTHRVAEAEAMLLEVLPAVRAGGDGPLLARTLRCLGQIEPLLERDSWRERLDEATRAARAADNGTQEAVVVAQRLIRATERDQVDRLALRGQELLESMGGDERIEAVLLGGLISAWFRADRVADAQRAWRRLDPLMTRLGERYQWAVYNSGVTVLGALDLTPDEARRALDDAERRFREIGAVGGIGWPITARGVVEHLDRGPAAALPHYTRALRSPDVSTDDRFKALVEVLVALATAERTPGGAGKAEEILASALHDRRHVGPGPRWLARLAARARKQTSQAPSWTVSLDGGRFVGPDGEEVDLSSRGPARRILAALARNRLHAPGDTLEADALIDAGWPGERILPEPARNRLYTTIRELRRLGLADALQTVDRGYRLGDEVDVA